MRPIQNIKIATLLSLAAMTAASPALAKPPSLTVKPQRPSGLYQPGETASFQIASQTASAQKATCIFSLNNLRLLKKQKVSLVEGRAECSHGLKQPGVLRLKVQAATDAASAAAVFGAQQIVVSQPPPADFKQFWDKQIQTLRATPPNATVTKVETLSNKDNLVYRVTMDNIDGSKIHGWLCRPAGKRRYPGMLLLPSAGVYPPDAYSVCGYNQKIVFKMSVHDIPLDAPLETYNQKERGQLSDYPRLGANSPQSYYFRKVYLAMVRSLDFLASEPQWDRRNLFVAGSSQGGGLAIVAAGLDQRVTAVSSLVPGLGDLRGALSQERRSGWPALVSGKTKGGRVKTAGYFDAAYFAPQIRAHVLMGVGLIDDICPPTSVYAVFNAIGSTDKTLLTQPTTGHDGPPDWLTRQDKFFAQQLRKR